MRRVGLLWALACQLLLSTGYLLAVPAFEAPDENDHLAYAVTLAQSGRPPLIPGTSAALGRPVFDEAIQGYHPPLYYGLLAGTLAALDRTALVIGARRNPDFGDFANHPPDLALKFEHGPDETPPVSDGIALLRLLRGLSVLLGLVTLVLVHRLGRLAFPGHPAVADAAALVTACLPRWSFIHGALNNDILAATLAHAALLVLALVLARGRLDPRRAALAGLLVGAALITKMSTLFLLPVAGFVLVFAWVRWRGQRRATLLGAALGTLVLLATCGWFFLRNRLLYGSLLALGAHTRSFADVAVPEGRHLEWLFAHFLPLHFSSLFGYLGWWTVPPARSVLVLAGLAGALAAVGWVLAALGRSPIFAGSRRPVVALLVLAVLLLLASTVRYNLMLRGPSARYLFPALGPLVLLVMAGLATVAAPVPERVARVGRPLLALLPPAVGAFVLLGQVAPALDPALAPAPPWHSSLKLFQLAPPSGPELTWLAPADGARPVDPPELVWKPAPGDRPDRVYSVHAVTTDGRVVLATEEWLALDLTEARWTVPEAFWLAWPAGQPIAVQVLGLPDRTRGEDAAHAPASPVLHLTRAGDG